MIDIEQRALCALEQNPFAFAAFLIEQIPHRIRERQNSRRNLNQLFQNIRAVNFLQIEPAPQRIVMRQRAVDLVRQRLQIGEVHQADRAAADFIFVSRTDAALRSADRVRAAGGFANRIEFTMQRQYQRDVFGDAQIVRRDRDVLRAQFIQFGKKRLRIEHHAIADHRQLRGPQHT